MSEIKFRYAKPGDEELVLEFIKGIAEYEKMTDEVENTAEMIRRELFIEKAAEVLFALNDDGKEVGFALFFNNYSTFVGKRGLYLEDLFVFPQYRGKGYGNALFCKLAAIAVERGYGRMEWCCLDWNQPSIDFYTAHGARMMDGWHTYRLAGDTLKNAAEMM